MRQRGEEILIWEMSHSTLVPLSPGIGHTTTTTISTKTIKLIISIIKRFLLNSYTSKNSKNFFMFRGFIVLPFWVNKKKLILFVCVCGNECFFSFLVERGGGLTARQTDRSLPAPICALRTKEVVICNKCHFAGGRKRGKAFAKCQNAEKPQESKNVFPSFCH